MTTFEPCTKLNVVLLGLRYYIVVMMKNILLSIILIISIFCFNSCSLFEDGYLYVGDGWQDTPEKALELEADNTAETEQMLTIASLLDTRHIDDIAIMTFVSKGDTLVTATFVTNEEGQYHYHGCTEEVSLENPTSFVLNGNDEQFILFPYQQYNPKVFGWSYSTQRSTTLKLLINGLVKFTLGIVLIAAMLFLPAWTFDYPGAWLFLAVLFIPMLIVGVVLFVRSPALLEKRLDVKEKEATQKGVVALSGLIFPLGFIVSALDFRFSLSVVPMWCTVIAAALFLCGYGMYAEVMRENAYLSRTVEVQEGQRVIDSGLYGLVRHPMYLATLLMFIPIPLILSSFLGLIPFAFYPAVIVIRILNEEKVLTAELAGYTEYKGKVKYRLIPFIW